MTPIPGTLSRRGFLRTSGRAAGGAIVVAVGGLGGRAWAQGVFGDLYAGPAFEPWRDWRRGRHQGSLGLVAAAILASNPHNSQPWLFRVGERHVELFADPSRHLGTIDPFRREMHLGLGCALESGRRRGDPTGRPQGGPRRRASPPGQADRPRPRRAAPDGLEGSDHSLPVVPAHAAASASGRPRAIAPPRRVKSRMPSTLKIVK